MADQPTIKAIPTKYKGYTFRSRLEARWAVAFDHFRLTWTYEPEGFELGNGTRYLPDFWIEDWQAFLEIKPAGDITMGLEKCVWLAVGSKRPVVLVVGNPWPSEYEALVIGPNRTFMPGAKFVSCRYCLRISLQMVFANIVFDGFGNFRKPATCPSQQSQGCIPDENRHDEIVEGAFGAARDTRFA